MTTKLHIGCGSIIKPGYVNIDEYNPKADRQLSILNLDYPDASVDLIEGYHVIEHLSRFDAERFFSMAYRMLKDGGVLHLECPDLEKVARIILRFADDSEYLEYGPYGFRGLFGEPHEEMTVGDFHKWGYTPATMRHHLFQAGFRHVEISDGYSHSSPLRDLCAIATK